MKRRTLVGSLVATLVVCVSLVFAEGVSLEGVKCLMAPKDAKEANAADWKDGKVYFCCGGCKGKFEKMSKDDKEKMAAKSNAQLVATKQYKQEACPISGGKLNLDTAIEVGGAKVAFCCGNCKGKVESMKDDEKMETVYGEKAFAKAKFTKVESK
ncbi:MAG: hypothetical protein KF752_07725 [Pirellulaceae bacterium]|nr:hypothetical protein [Pirellulaceae bacterium]